MDDDFLTRPESYRLHWPWLYAKHVMESGRRLTRADDPALRRVVQFRRRLERARAVRHRVLLLRDYPDLFAAHALFHSHNLPRRELEARLLARQPHAAIAQAMAAAEPVVAAYAQVFYRVPKHNDALATRHLLEQLLRDPHWQSQDPAAWVVWLWTALMHGLPLLQVLLDEHHGRPAENGEERRQLADLALLHGRLCLSGAFLREPPKATQTWSQAVLRLPIPVLQRAAELGLLPQAVTPSPPAVPAALAPS